MENIFFSYQRLIYHEIGSILNDPWSKDDIFQTVIVQLINNIDTLRPMPAKVLTSYRKKCSSDPYSKYQPTERSPRRRI